LHNNHHAFPTSAKLSVKWYEFDLGWGYIRGLEMLGLAQIKHLAPTAHFTQPKQVIGDETLQAVIKNRYDVLARYTASIRRTYAAELEKLRQASPADAVVLQNVKRWLYRDEMTLREREREEVEKILATKTSSLWTVYTMRRELARLWARSTLSRDELVRRLQEWVQRAEASGIAPLVEFSRSLRSYG
jgi:stearoyl-CoA desaturase (delta-9 desaturase)